MLIKGNPTEFSNKSILHPLLRKDINEVLILDYRLRCRLNDKSVPIKFLDKIFVVSKNSFIQNNTNISRKIRKNVSVLLSEFSGSILGLGGETYMYLSLLENNSKKNFITNNESIYNDSIFNNLSRNYETDLVNYEKVDILKTFEIAVVNLSNLNSFLMKQLNYCVRGHIIIISCNHNDFWKKTKLLTKFKLKSRKRIIDNTIGYFITVNLLSRKKS